MNITFRILQPADVKQYREIRLESLKNYPGSFGSTYEESIFSEKIGLESYIEEQTPGKFIIGAFLQKALIGICGFFQSSQKKSRHKGSIIQMYIRPKYQGKGFGRQLLQSTLEEAFRISEIEQILLDVITTNKSANRLYEQAGFQEYGVHKKCLKENNTYFDERLMVLYRSK